MKSVAIFLPAAAVTCTFFINLCNWIYRCGCASLWAGADAHCNVHNATGRHCPFCAHGLAGYAAVLSLILIAQFVLSRWPPRWDWRLRSLLALLAFPAVISVAAAVLGWLDNYWA
jgi:hypothetical protein